MNNQMAYAFGDVVPDMGMAQVGDSNLMQVVYQRRRDAAERGLDYRIEWTDNLVSNVWNSTGIDREGSAVLDAHFEVVTNQVPLDLPNKFIRFETDLSE